MCYTEVAMKKQLGFTLVELLIAVAIIGLLAAMVSFSVPYARARARDAKRVADIDQFMKALDLYVNQTGAYPLAVTPVCLDGTDEISDALISESLINTAVKEPLYTDPSRCFSYSTDAAGESYAIDFYLETQAVGNQGLNTRP